MGLDSENHLFRNLPDALKTKIERSVYNRRKRKLSFAINEIRLKLRITNPNFTCTRNTAKE